MKAVVAKDLVPVGLNSWNIRTRKLSVSGRMALRRRSDYNLVQFRNPLFDMD